MRTSWATPTRRARAPRARRLLGRVEHHEAGARGERRVEVVAALGVPVHDEVGTAEAGPQRRRHLARAGHVGAEPLVVDQPQHAGRRERLEREDGAPAGGRQRLLVGPGAEADGGRVVDVERRAEAVGQRLGVDAADREATARRLGGTREALHHAPWSVASTSRCSASSLLAPAPRHARPGARRQGRRGGRLGESLAGGDAARDVLVRLAERHALADERLGDVGRHREAVVRRGRHARGVEPEAGVGQGQDVERGGVRIGLREDGLLVLLQVAVVRERQALEGREEPGQASDRGTGTTAHELAHVGVLLLGHHARARRDGVVELRPAELARRPEHELLPQAREVHEPQGRRVRQVAGEVAVRDGVEGVAEARLEVEVSRDTLGVEWKARPGQRSRPQRAARGGRLAGRAQPLDIALDRPRMRQPGGGPG